MEVRPKKEAKIVVGLGFGDEGKGLTTDYVCSQSKQPIVVRFNGGQQAGHTVVTANGRRHVFSNFGSGTLRGIPTYWSRYCTFSPIHFLNELHELRIQPKLYIDPHCPITTHYDILFNRALELTPGHVRRGTTGTGFGATLKRHFESGLALTFENMLDSNLTQKALKKVNRYYGIKIKQETDYQFGDFDHATEDLNFIKATKEISVLQDLGIIEPTSSKFLTSEQWSTLVFEGSQGILLDPTLGFSPFVTRTNTTSQNAVAILKQLFKPAEIRTELYYVTRIYHTRHGAGPFQSASPSQIRIQRNSSETNKRDDYQGKFRIGPLNTDLTNYSLKCDSHFSNGFQKHLIVTCIDQLESEDCLVSHDGYEEWMPYYKINDRLAVKFKTKLFSESPCADLLK